MSVKQFKNHQEQSLQLLFALHLCDLALQAAVAYAFGGR
jgi:hypothetical protein